MWSRFYIFSLISIFFYKFILISSENVTDSMISSSNTNLSQIIDSQLNQLAEGIYEVLDKTAKHSWEWGTQCQVILERYYPRLSVYSNQSIPIISSNHIKIKTKKLLKVIQPILKDRRPGPGPIIKDDAAGDPASLMIGIMILGLTNKKGSKPYSRKYYLKIAKRQLRFLLDEVPRTSEGAISHRVAEVQLWSDFMFMGPPSIAYYGAVTSDKALLHLAYQQSKLYRKTLQDPVTKTWKHIHLGSFNESLLWSTGTGWAVAGMMRIWATMNNVDDHELKASVLVWKQDLTEWIIETIVGAFEFQCQTKYLLPNHYGSEDTFFEVSGTAIIVATAYRLIAAQPDTKSRLPICKIDLARKAILENHIDPQTKIVSPVVDPLNWKSKVPLESSKASPEGQAFVLLMISAWEALQIQSSS